MRQRLFSAGDHPRGFVPHFAAVDLAGAFQTDALTVQGNRPDTSVSNERLSNAVWIAPCNWGASRGFCKQALAPAARICASESEAPLGTKPMKGRARSGGSLESNLSTPLPSRHASGPVASNERLRSRRTRSGRSRMAIE